MATASPEPPPSGQVVMDGAAEAGVSGDDDYELRQLPDQLLQGKMERMQRGVDGGIAVRLPDGGKTYRLKLLAICRELERRQAAAALSAPPPPPPSSSSQPPPTSQGEPRDGDRCATTLQSSYAESSDIQATSSLPAQDGDRCAMTLQSSCAESSDIQATSSLPAQIETAACPLKPLPVEHIIKPEPFDDSPVPAPEAADDWETTPLSGDHPFFTIILSRSHVQKPFQLCIPGRFLKHLPEVRTAATLICRGKSWPMSYRGDLKAKKLDADWMDFAVDNRLQVNDACVFELVTVTKEEMVFHMQILRGDLPEEIIYEGATADKPIIIVD